MEALRYFPTFNMDELPQGGLEIPLSRRCFAQITPRYCLKFMLKPSLPNHADTTLIDHAKRNHFIKFPFSRSESYPIMPSHFSLGGPLEGQVGLKNQDHTFAT